MIFRLFSSDLPKESIASLYGAIVAQARAPALYQTCGVPDTVNGRFEMIVLHVALLLSRLEREGSWGRRLGQAVFDRFCHDMDANLREMGVGDLAVPRQMKSVGEAFYGRKRAYEAADTERLAAAVARNVYGWSSGPQPPGAARLAAYVRGAADRLTAMDRDALLSGRSLFPASDASVFDHEPS